MRILARSVAVFGLVLVLSGCASQEPSPQAKSDPVPEAQESGSTAVQPGSKVVMKNGLSVTVPKGWEATMTVFAKPTDPLNASERLLLDNPEATESPRVVMIFSSESRTLKVSALDEYGQRTFRPGATFGNTSILVSDEPSMDGMHMMVALHQRSHAQLGVVFFGGDPEDSRASLERVTRLLAIDGI